MAALQFRGAFMINEINGVLTGLSAAAGITKGIVHAESALEKAELKFRLAELMQHIAEAQAQMADIKISSLAKDEEIRGLLEKLKVHENLVRDSGVYYRSTDEGKPYGEAICSNCWDVKKTLVHLVQPTATWKLKCPNCKQDYGSGKVRRVIK